MHIPTTLIRARRCAEKAIAEIRAFCPTGPGGGIDPTCSPGGSGGGTRALASFAEQLPLDEYGRRSGVKPLGPIETTVYRVGAVDNFKDRGGVFFGGRPEDAKPYASLHEGSSSVCYVQAWDSLGIPGELQKMTARSYNPEGQVIAEDAGTVYLVSLDPPRAEEITADRAQNIMARDPEWTDDIPPDVVAAVRSL